MVQSSAVVAGTNGTATEYNQLRNDTLLGLKNMTAQTSGTIDLSASNDFDITLDHTATKTLTFSNVVTGQWFQVTLIEDSTGGCAVTWPAGIKWPGGSAPPLSSAANAVDTFVIKCTGAGAYRGYFGGFGLS